VIHILIVIYNGLRKRIFLLIEDFTDYLQNLRFFMMTSNVV
jgi:hypothetical protein